jgi:hypothetical protein
LRLLETLRRKESDGEQLDLSLISAVRKQQLRLAEAMIGYGPFIEYEHAWAMRTAWATPNLELLSVLLQGPCTLKALSAAIPDTMLIKSKPLRFQAIKALLEKEVLPSVPDIALQEIVAEDGGIDLELIQLLLQHKALCERNWR